MSPRLFENLANYKMDPKFRVSIPVDWRPEVEETPVRLQLSKEHEQPVIKVYDEPVFEQKFEEVAKSDLTPVRKQQIVGHLRTMSKKATINQQGKLTIPKEWAERVGLQADGPVILAGRGPYYLLCTTENFDRITAAELAMDDGGLGVL